MARCWTCGKLTSEPVHKCSTCRNERSLKALGDELGIDINRLAKVEQQGFESLSDNLDGLRGILQNGFRDVSNRLQEINTTLEWGFGEISWELEQQTKILQSIDHTLKTPTQTKANEWREMAEELRNRGVLDDAEKVFLRSLDVIEGNPLDYRSYIGLARTYIQMNEFNKARTFLEKSIPHAPDNSYKNYSYRMIGHVDECVGDYHSAVSALKSAIETSPNSYIAHYDLARCSAKSEFKEICLSSLKTAIIGNSIYFYISENADFEPLSIETQKLLQEIKSNTLNELKANISKAEKMLFNNAKESMTRIKEAFKKCINAEEILTPDIKNLETAESKLELAKDKASWKDYKGFLDAIQISKETYDIAYKTKDSLDSKHEHYENTHSKRVRKAISEFFFIVGPAILIGLVCSPIGGCAGCNIGNEHHKGHNYLIGSTIVVILAAIIGIIVGIVNAVKGFNTYE